MANNLNYNVNVNANNGIQALNNLQNKVGALNSAFSSLKGAVAGIAVGSILTSLLNFADNIQDLSDATGIATQNLLGFQKAVKGFGGDADGADKAVLRLVSNVGAAADGSAELQYAFSRVGVSMQDLANLSEEEILAKTIKGLGDVTDKSEQAYLKQQLLGKEFRNVAASGLAEAYAKATVESEKYAASIKAAAETQQKLEEAIGKIKLAALEAIKPAADFINSLDQKTIEQFIKVLGELAVAMGSLWALVKIAEGLKFVLVVLGEIAAVALTVARNITPIGRVISGLIALAGALGLAVQESTRTDFVNGLYKILGLTVDKQKELNETGVADTSQAHKNNADAAKQNADGVNAAGNAARKVVDPFKALKDQIDGVSESFARANAQNVASIELSTRMIGMSKQEAEAMKANAEITKKAADEIQKLKDQKAKLTEAQKAAGIGGIIDAEIAAIQKQAEVDKAATEAAIKNSEARQNARKLEEFSIKSQIDVENELMTIQDDMAKSTMTALEQKYYDIDRAAQKSAKSAIEAEEARRGAKLDPTEAEAYYEAARKGTEELKRASEISYNSSRTFATGWTKAFNEYRDAATNSANIAQNIFKKATQGMEDMIVNFAKTGKFEWKNFVAMMLEELLRAQIQQIFAQLLGGMTDSMRGATGGGGGGLLGGIGSMIGGLFGGQQALPDDFMGPPRPGQQRASQQGPGLMAGVGNLLGGIGSSISSGIGSAVSGIGDALGSITSGIGSMFDGWFANGGTIGAGKFGIVGENGPEFVGGPATVTPMSAMGGSGTNVTYNINAVDAMSFKQMLAQDPSFIYALSLQGAGNVPARR